MTDFDFKKVLFNMPSAEEMEANRRDRYETNLHTPENFSNWFPVIKEAMLNTDTVLGYPESIWHTISYEWIRWLQSDNYSDEKIQEFTDYLLDNLELEEGKKYFIKTGVFSDKFDFSHPKLEDIHNIGRQFLDIFYTAMLVGADNTNEIVIREYIEPKEKVETIYNGMPLHTEYRVFVDIDNDDSGLLGVVNYWHPKVMNHKGIGKDLAVYQSAENRIVSTFNKNKNFVGEEILKIAKSIEGISGSWSIDVMQNGDEFYVIDSARLETSALTEFIKGE